MSSKPTLSSPFQESEIEWRLAQCGFSNNKFWGMAVAYITARAIMDRLDHVFGCENWKVSYLVQDKFVLCDLSIRFGNEWITKTDGAEFTDIEPVKGGISGALKRAGSVWGMGRYLYQLESAFIQVVDKNTTGCLYGKTKDGKTFNWLPPKLPAWALPPASTPKKEAAPVTPKEPAKVIAPKGEVKPEVPPATEKKAPLGPRSRRDQLEDLIADKTKMNPWTSDQVKELLNITCGPTALTALTSEEWSYITTTIKTQFAAPTMEALRKNSRSTRIPPVANKKPDNAPTPTDNPMDHDARLP